MSHPEFRFEVPAETQRTLAAFSKRTQQIGRELAASIVIPKIELPPLPTDFVRRMQGIAERMVESARRGWPPNWEDNGWDTRVMLARIDIIDTEGLPLVWVPRSSLVTDLTSQQDAEARIEILLARAEDALDACDEQLCQVDDAGLAPITDGVAKAIEAWRGGHPAAAQALATNALDTTITRSYGLGSRAAGREFDVALEEAPIGVLRQAMVLVAVHRALVTFNPISDPIPTRYNRHATVHAVSPEQYSEANALIALLLATSLVRERHTGLHSQ